MACGKPIITTEWKGCRDTVKHGRNGYLIDVDDFDSLKGRIEELITAPSEQLIEMGKAGRQKAEAQFDENQVINAYMQQIDKDYVFPASDSSSEKYQKEPVFSDTL